MSLKQKKINFKPRIKLNHDIHMHAITCTNSKLVDINVPHGDSVIETETETEN